MAHGTPRARNCRSTGRLMPSQSVLYPTLRPLASTTTVFTAPMSTAAPRTSSMRGMIASLWGIVTDAPPNAGSAMTGTYAAASACSLRP